MEEEAKEFAREAHKDQFRKYKKEPYIEHPIRVAKLVSTVPHTKEMICAAYLHDVVEDTPVNIAEIQKRFGDKVAGYVQELTDVYVKQDYPHLNRKARKEKEVQRLSQISNEAKTIKLADVIDNTRDIVDNDKGFARKYVPEMEAVVEVLKGGNYNLFNIANQEVIRGKQILAKKKGYSN